MYDIDDADLMTMSIEERNAIIDRFNREMDEFENWAQARAEVEAEQRNEHRLAFPDDGRYAGSEEDARDRWLDSLAQETLPMFVTQNPLPGFEG